MASIRTSHFCPRLLLETRLLFKHCQLLLFSVIVCASAYTLGNTFTLLTALTFIFKLGCLSKCSTHSGQFYAAVPAVDSWSPPGRLREAPPPGSKRGPCSPLPSPPPLPIGVGAQSTLWGHKIFARQICITNQQNVRILHDSCPKNYIKYPNF